jgi:hypothetical protein
MLPSENGKLKACAPYRFRVAPVSAGREEALQEPRLICCTVQHEGPLQTLEKPLHG